MYRDWTGRKATTLDESAIDAEKFNRAYPVFRADPEPADARRQTLRLLVTYCFLWLPMHCAICWFWAQSAGLAATAVIVIAGAAFLLAGAKWLGLEDLLQKLPLLVVLALALIG